MLGILIPHPTNFEKSSSSRSTILILRKLRKLSGDIMPNINTPVKQATFKKLKHMKIELDAKTWEDFLDKLAKRWTK